MATKPCDLWYHMCEPFVPHGQVVIHVKFHLDLFSNFREEDFWRVVFFKTIWLPNHVTDDAIKKFSVDHFIPRWPSKIVTLIGCGVIHMKLWRHNEGTYDVIKIKLILHEEYLLCAKFQFFPWCGFIDTEIQSFSVLFTYIIIVFHYHYYHYMWLIIILLLLLWKLPLS